MTPEQLEEHIIAKCDEIEASHQQRKYVLSP